MNIENLKQYLKNANTIKNYIELCEILEEKITNVGSNSKKSRLKEFERYVKYHKDGNKFIIDEIYKIPLKKVDNRKGNSGTSEGSRCNNIGKIKQFNNLKINKSEYNLIGVYAIVLNKDIYIGSTIQGFRDRFLRHNDKSNDLCTKEMLTNGAIFKILWIANNNEDEFFIRNMENFYIKQYRKDNNWNVVNTNDAWSYTQGCNKIEPKTKYIKIDKDKYEKALELLKINNLI